MKRRHTPVDPKFKDDLPAKVRCDTSKRLSARERERILLRDRNELALDAFARRIGRNKNYDAQ